MEVKKNGFASKIGFILAGAGSAIGLGNLWSFPYKVYANGGAAFVVVYILSILLIGLVAMVAELYIGRRASANTVTSYSKINKKLGWVGLLVVLIPFLITCYYVVLGGWTIKFAVNSIPVLGGGDNVSIFGEFISDPVQTVVFGLIFLGLAVAIIMGGVKAGIEKMSKILMPMLFVIIIFIAIYCLCLGEGVSDGLAFYLMPDFNKLGLDGVIAAMGQAFYSMSLGMGIMVSYGSYTGKEIKLGQSAMMIAIFDTCVALIAGLGIFSAIGALSPEILANNTIKAGPTLMFVILPQVFADMGVFGYVISFLFFAMVAIAAVTSVISLLEVVSQYVIQRFKINRKKASLIIGLIMFAISIPIAWSVGGAFDGVIKIAGYDLLTLFDEATNTVLMPIGAFISCMAVGWFIDKNITPNPMATLSTLKADGLELNPTISMIFSVMVKYVTPALILLVEIAGLIGKFTDADYISMGGYIYPVIVGGLMVVASIVIFYAYLKNKTLGTNADEEIIDKTTA
ncbi:MAG: sodium-dependent transporter [Clostridia bacterium]|nr:sodium-dependent transporter [Clostridia bacterium]